MKEHKTYMNITKSEKYKKISKSEHTTDKDKDNQMHSHIKMHNERLNNNKIEKYQKLSMLEHTID